MPASRAASAEGRPWHRAAPGERCSSRSPTGPASRVPPLSQPRCHRATLPWGPRTCTDVRRQPRAVPRSCHLRGTAATRPAPRGTVGTAHATPPQGPARLPSCPARPGQAPLPCPTLLSRFKPTRAAAAGAVPVGSVRAGHGDTVRVSLPPPQWRGRWSQTGSQRRVGTGRIWAAPGLDWARWGPLGVPQLWGQREVEAEGTNEPRQLRAVPAPDCEPSWGQRPPR